MSDLPVLIEPRQLHSHLNDDQLLLIDLSKPEHYARAHIPGAVNVSYARLVAAEPPAMGLLPDEESLSELFSELGLTPETQVVAYDDEGSGRAARLLWTLDVIGHPHAAVVDGGIGAWQAAGLPTESTPRMPTPSQYRASLSGRALATREDILERLGKPGQAFVDARTPEEYAGTDVRAERGGHIPGAVNLNWLDTMDDSRDLRLKPRAELQSMLDELGVKPGHSVVTYCQTHHRSALLYLVLKSLGYSDIAGYPGSWSDWGNHPDTPIESDA